MEKPAHNWTLLHTAHSSILEVLMHQVDGLWAVQGWLHMIQHHAHQLLSFTSFDMFSHTGSTLLDEWTCSYKYIPGFFSFPRRWKCQYQVTSQLIWNLKSSHFIFPCESFTILHHLLVLRNDRVIRCPTSHISVQKLAIPLTNLICWFIADELLLSLPMKGGHKMKTRRLHYCNPRGFHMLHQLSLQKCAVMYVQHVAMFPGRHCLNTWTEI